MKIRMTLCYLVCSYNNDIIDNYNQNNYANYNDIDNEN